MKVHNNTHRRWHGIGRQGGRIGCLAILVMLTSVGSAETLFNLSSADFSKNKLWDDGKFEIATYDCIRPIDGKDVPHKAALVTAYEELNKEFYTRSDFPYGQKPLLSTLRQTFSTDFPASPGLSKVFSTLHVERSDPGKGVKLTVSTNEWDRSAFKEFRLWKSQPEEFYASPWDGEGSGVRSFSYDADAFFEEQLTLTLRSIPFVDGLQADFKLFDSQLTTRAATPVASPAFLQCTKGDAAWEVMVKAADGRIIDYTFALSYPHVMESMRHSDGRSMKLVSVERKAPTAVTE